MHINTIKKIAREIAHKSSPRCSAGRRYEHGNKIGEERPHVSSCDYLTSLIERAMIDAAEDGLGGRDDSQVRREGT